MKKNCWLVAALGAGLILTGAATAHAVEPVNPKLIPEARRLLEYLKSIEGKGIISGSVGTGGGSGPFEAYLHRTGREPALRGGGPGFGAPGSELDRWSRPGVDAHLFWGREKGGIVYILCHWEQPAYGDQPRGSAWKGRPKEVKPVDIGRMVTPGTEEYQALLRDLSYTANSLEELAKARVPVLWCPFHEISGGWFWWTDTETPENTAALYRLAFNYLTRERGLNNLIWVYHDAHRCGIAEGGASRADREGKKFTLEEEIEIRRRFYPGPEYVDIAGLSTYGNPRIGWGAGWEDARQKAYELMKGVAPGKPLAICETPQQIHPLMAQKQGVAWMWSMAWYPGAPTDWLRYALNHEHMITLDELPLFRDANVMPNARLDWPADNLQLGTGEIQISGVATDRNGNLKSVSVHVLSEPWLDWSERGDRESSTLRTPGVKEEFERGRCLGEARLGPGGRWTFTWANPPAGFHQLAAFARDTEGAVGASNVARIMVGLPENLARGKPVSVSSFQKGWGEPEGAVDDEVEETMWRGDNTAWSTRSKEPPVEWLQVDLEKERTVGAVSVLWWKAYAKDYTVQVSSDGQTWREVGRVEGRNKPMGDSDVIRFQPVQARHVRLHCTKPVVTWQAFCVYDFRVYESLPEQK